jgi:hypothetical protein
MGGQKYVPPIDKDREAVDQQKAAEKSDHAWRTQQMLQSVMPSSSGRVIDWRRM